MDRPPIWLMRQAGRALPEYRALRERHSFLDLVRTPDLATEVTLQPMRRFGFDAAVIFSDILVACEAMGQGYRFREAGGIEMDFAIEGLADVERLESGAVRERLAYLGQSIGQVKREIGETAAMLGFAGSPWTLGCFMFEGGSAREFRRAKACFYGDRPLFDRFMARLSDTVAELLLMQADAGADAVQIFDSTAELLSADDYEAASARWIRQIVQRVAGRVPVILYVRGMPAAVDRLLDSGISVFSVDWRVDLPGLKARLPDRIAVQGNLDPFLMTTSPEVVRGATMRLLDSMRGVPGHIVNLGHGLPPNAGLEHIEALVGTVKASGDRSA